MGVHRDSSVSGNRVWEQVWDVLIVFSIEHRPLLSGSACKKEALSTWQISMYKGISVISYESFFSLYDGLLQIIPS